MVLRLSNLVNSTGIFEIKLREKSNHNKYCNNQIGEGIIFIIFEEKSKHDKFFKLEISSGVTFILLFLKSISSKLSIGGNWIEKI
jgi:hypothetical protein